MDIHTVKGHPFPVPLLLIQVFRTITVLDTVGGTIVSPFSLEVSVSRLLSSSACKSYPEAQYGGNYSSVKFWRKVSPYFQLIISTMGFLRGTLAKIQCDVLPSDPEEREKLVRLEARARAMFKTIRCLECANQAIGDSESYAAQALRREVRQRLRSGDNEEQVRKYLVDKYGDKVTYAPEEDAFVYAMYAVPLIMLAGALALSRRRKAP